MDHPTVRRGRKANSRHIALRIAGPLAFALALILFIYLLPRVPPVRTFIVNQALGLASNAGFDVSADSSTGDVWRGLTLRDVRVQREGLDAEVEVLELSYFLPALLRRTLPLSVNISGLSGDLDLEAFSVPASGAPSPVQVQLRDLQVENSSFAAEQLPFTLPDFRLRDLQTQTRVGGFDLGFSVATIDGSADVVASAKLEPLRIAANVKRADATLARHWWGGVTGGVATGDLRYADGSFTAELDLVDGSLEFLNEEVTGISGPVRYGRNIVEAQLSADTLGGDLSADVEVDIPARRWMGQARGGVRLAEVATWLATNRIPFDVSTLNIEGGADVQVEAFGWRSVDLRGYARGAGEVLGQSLSDLEADFGFLSGEGTRLRATAGLANGTVLATLTPQNEGFVFDISAEDVSPQPWTSADLSFGLSNVGGELSADGDLGVSVQRLGRDIAATVDLSLNEGVWQAELTGGDTLGETLQGSAEFSNGRLESQLSAQTLQIPGLSATPDVVLSASGPPSDLALSVALDAADPVTLELPRITSSADLRGSASAVYSEGKLNALRAAFGPLVVSGELSGETRELTYALAPTQLDGLVSGLVAARAGRLDLDNRSSSFELLNTNLSVAGIGLPNTQADVSFDFAETLNASLSAPDAGLEASLVGNSLATSFDDVALSMAGQTLALSGSANYLLGDLASLDLDLNAASDSLAASVQGGAAALIVSAEAPYTQLGGEFNILEPAGTLQGTLAGLDLSAEGSLQNSVVAANAQLGGVAGLSLNAAGPLDAVSAALTGSLDIEPVAQRFELPATGVLTSDLRYDAGTFSGAAQLDAEAANVPLDLTLSPAGDTLALTGTARPYGQQLDLSGSLVPLDIRAASEYGQLGLSPNTAGELILSGAGETPALTRAGWQLAAQPWNLNAEIAEREARLELGKSLITGALGSEGWTLQADLAQRASRANGASAELVGRVSASADNPAGSLDGVLNLNTSGTATPETATSTFTLNGSLDSVTLDGSLAGEQAASLAGIPTGLNGDIRLAGSLEPRELSYRANGVWQAGPQELSFDVRGQGADLNAQAEAEALGLDYADGELKLNARDFDPAPFFGALTPGSTLTGDLSYAPTSERWDGTLNLDLALAGGVAAQLTGEGEALLLDAQAASSAWSFEAAGQVLPDLGLSVSAKASERAELNATLSGSPAAPEISGTLATQAFTFNRGVSVNVPAQSFELSSDADALALLVDNGESRLRLSPAELAGELALPFELQGEAHSLSADLAGSLSQPDITASVTGPLLTGPVSLSSQGLTTRLELDPSPLVPGDALGDASLSLDASLNRDLQWRAELGGGARYETLPLTLGGNFSGEGATFSGAGALQIDQEIIPFSAANETGELQASAVIESFDLASLQGVAPIDLNGNLDGDLTLDSSRATPFSFELNADGNAGGLPLNLDATFREGVLNLNASALDSFVAVESLGQARYSVRAFSSQAERPLSLEGNLNLAQAYSLNLAGSVVNDALNVSAAYDPEVGEGRLQTSFATAELSADVTRSGSSWQLATSLDDPNGELANLPLAGNVSAQVSGSAVNLSAVELSSTVLDEETRLSLSGPVWPQPQVDGSLLLGELGALAVNLTQSEGAYEAQLAQEGLELSASLDTSGLRSVQLASDSQSELVDKLVDKFAPSAQTDLIGTLTWTNGAGFGGAAGLSAGFAGADASLGLVGQGPLLISGDLGYTNLVEGQLELNLNAPTLADFRSADALAGSLALVAGATSLADAPSETPLILSSNLSIGGSPLQPTLTGPLELNGPVSAAGDLSFAGRTGELSLLGDELELRANLSESGWQAVFDTAEAGLDLSSVVPQLDAPVLSADIRAAQRWGQAPNIEADVLELTLPNSLISAELAYNEGLQGALTLDMNLADVTVAELSGGLSGQVALLESGLSGVLDVNELRLAQRDERLDGNLSLGGTLAQPELTAQLMGSQAASGTLIATLEPGQMSLSSNLALAGLRTNFDISSSQTSLGQTSLSATGSLAYNDFALRLTEGETNTLLLNGEDRLAGWNIVLDVAQRSAALTGSLDTVAPSVQGQVDLRASLVEDALVSGRIAELAVAGIELGDLRVGGDQDRIQLSGDALEARLDVAKRSAELSRLDLALASDYALTGSGTGSLDEGAFELELTAQDSRLPLSLSYGAAGLSLAGEGDFLEGNAALFIEASEAAGWQGGFKLDALNLEGARVSAEGDVAGAFDAPRLESDLELGYQDAELAGTLVASRAGLNIDQRVSAPDLDVSLRGQLWPTPDVILEQNAERLRLFASSPAPQDAADAQNAAQLLGAEGELELSYGPLRVALEEVPDGFLRLHVAATREQLSGLAFATELPKTSPANFLSTLRADGLKLEGEESVSGALNVKFSDGLALQAEALSWRSLWGELSLDAQVAQQGGWRAQADGVWRGSYNGDLPWLNDLEQVPFQAVLNDSGFNISSSGSAGQLQAVYRAATGEGLLDANLNLGDGGLAASLGYSDTVGPRGEVVITDLPLGADISGLSARLELSPESVTGTASLGVGDGRLSATGELGYGPFVPARLAPQASDTQRLNIRADALQANALPFLSRYTPELDAELSGIAQLSGARIVGRVVSPQLNVADTSLPLSADFNGPPNNLNVGLSLGNSTFSGTLSEGALAGLFRFEQFPIEVIPEARVGDISLESSLTGRLRLELPFDDLGASAIRFASESIVLENNDSVTTGQLGFSYLNGDLVVDQAYFEGENGGRWSAAGEATAQQLNLSLDAENADFTPLLSLVPRLAAFGVGASGDLELNTSGSLRSPQAQLNSEALEFNVASTRYRLEDSSLTLDGPDLVLSANLNGVAPVTGELAINGVGQVSLSPLRPEDVRIEFSGDSFVPILGEIEAVAGTLSASEEGWQLASTGTLGEPFSVSGSLTPLDLNIIGQGLNVRAPQYFLAESASNVNLNVSFDEAFIVSGSLDASSAQIATSGRERRTDVDGVRERREPNRALERVLFNDLRVRAPQGIRLDENFGSAELGLDVTLSGSAAQPALNGRAETRRGTFSFSGQDFTLERAEAVFRPARGAYPTLDIQGRTSFTKTSVLGPEGRFNFVAPNGPTFPVLLSLVGDISAQETGPRAFNIDLDPQLSSPAVVQDSQTDGPPRNLEEQELYSLLTLGTLNLSDTLLGGGSVTENVAEGAIDTAIDFLILSGLQQELGEALGVDLLEIRTSSLSSLLIGQEEAFGVSFRIGGYLGEDLFASFQVANLDLESDELLRNEFSLLYVLDPLEFNLSSRLTFPRAGAENLSPVPEIDLTVAYAFNTLVRLETGISLAQAEQSASFGVSFRW